MTVNFKIHDLLFHHNHILLFELSIIVAARDTVLVLLEQNIIFTSTAETDHELDFLAGLDAP